MITAHHFICHGLTLSTHSGCVEYLKVFWAVNGFLYIGVNVFILISGYFGINFKLRKFLDLYLTCVFYSLALGLIVVSLQGGSKEAIRGWILSSLLPISHGGAGWFAVCYFLLMLIAPMINIARNALNKHDYLICLIALSVINLYFGYFWKLDISGNINGFTLMQFVFLYFIGGYIGRFISFDLTLRYRWAFLGGYLVFSVIYAFLSIWQVNHYVFHWDGWNYNNPVLILSSIFFFLFFLSFKLRSSVVNFAAKSVFGVYLAQDVLARSFDLYSKVGEWSSFHSNGRITVEYLLAFAAAVFFLTLVLLFDQLRKLATAPSLMLFDKCVSRTR